MTLIEISQVAEILGVAEARIERMTKENLLTVIEEQDGKKMYDKAAIDRYKTFADRLGGL